MDILAEVALSPSDQPQPAPGGDLDEQLLASPASQSCRDEEQEEEPAAKRRKCDVSLRETVEEMNAANMMQTNMAQQDLFNACGLPAGCFTSPNTDMLKPEEVLQSAAMMQRLQMMSCMLNQGAQESVMPPLMMMPPAMTW